VTASCMRHPPLPSGRPQQPKPELGDGHKHVQLSQEERRREAGAFGKRPQFDPARSAWTQPLRSQSVPAKRILTMLAPAEQWSPTSFAGEVGSQVRPMCHLSGGRGRGAATNVPHFAPNHPTASTRRQHESPWLESDAPPGGRPMASTPDGSCRALSRKWRSSSRECRDMGLVFLPNFFPSVIYLTHLDRSVELFCRT